MWKVSFLLRVAKLDAFPSISAPPSVQKVKVFFPKFYLAKNIFTILKMSKAFRASRRTHKIRILPWWYPHVYSKQRGSWLYWEISVERHQLIYICPSRLDACEMLFEFFWHSTSVHINLYAYTCSTLAFVFQRIQNTSKKYNAWSSSSVLFFDISF